MTSTVLKNGQSHARQTARRDRGFTLVEVMVALAVVAIALPALLMSLYQQTDGTAYLRDKSLARMVAANKLAEIRLVSAARSKVFVGKDSGVVELADRQWYWSLNSATTEIANFYRLDIKVAASEAQIQMPLFTLAAFMAEQPGDG